MWRNEALKPVPTTCDLKIPPVMAGAKPSVGWARPLGEHSFPGTNRNQESIGTQVESDSSGR